MLIFMHVNVEVIKTIKEAEVTLTVKKTLQKEKNSGKGIGCNDGIRDI